MNLLIIQCFASSEYQVNIDLKTDKNGLLKVLVNLPDNLQGEQKYIFPSTIPGTYAKYDFGRFVESAFVINKKGRRKKLKKADVNSFIIPDASKAELLEFNMKSTWTATTKERYVFQTAGTYFKNNEVFVFNFAGICGYISGSEFVPIQINIGNKGELTGVSSISQFQTNGSLDQWKVKSYHELIDSPLMYHKTDTTQLKVGNTQITFSVYSEGGKIKSKEVAEALKPLTYALKNFFGNLPVDRYTFMYYFKDPKNMSIMGDGGLGALEHNYSSFYFLENYDDSAFVKQIVRDISSHEFMHILTPLNIHSEEIHYFDFENPKMSQHLWMYEGVTEYFSRLVQLKNGLITEKKFMQIMKEKIDNMAMFDNFSFTEMSKNILKDPYIRNFGNVYEKGAILAFLLDILITEQSNGTQNLTLLMQELAKQFGPNKPFKDDELFSKINELTQNKSKQFIEQYIQGNDSLPLKSYLNKIGWEFFTSFVDSVVGFGRTDFSFDTNEKVLKIVAVDENMNLLKLLPGDIVIEINNLKSKDSDPFTFMEKFKLPKENETFNVTYIRNNQEYKISEKPVKYAHVRKNKIKQVDNVTEEQIKMKEWLME